MPRGAPTIEVIQEIEEEVLNLVLAIAKILSAAKSEATRNSEARLTVFFGGGRGGPSL